MKKILIASNVVLLSIIFFQACKPTVKEDDSNNTTCLKKICKDYTDVPWRGSINAYFAQKIADNYKRDAAKKFIWYNGNNSGQEDARSIWFSLETLKKFIWQIEASNCNKGCNDSLGVRIYYARYPEAKDPIWKTFNLQPAGKYANHHTVFMVPTFWEQKSNLHYDFDPSLKVCHSPFDTAISAKPTLLLFGFAGGATEPGDAQNHGNLIPPDLSGSTSF